MGVETPQRTHDVLARGGLSSSYVLSPECLVTGPGRGVPQTSTGDGSGRKGSRGPTRVVVVVERVWETKRTQRRHWVLHSHPERC